MNRKNKTVKQLQAECKKRKVGYMGNWTKTALIKRLEDEDRRDIDIKKLKDEINKKEKSRKVMHDKLQVKDTQLKTLEAHASPEKLRLEAEEKLKTTKQRRLNSLQKKFDILHQRELDIAEENNKVAEEKLEIFKEMESIKELMASLK